jgi:hypothetical protein
LIWRRIDDAYRANYSGYAKSIRRGADLLDKAAPPAGTEITLLDPNPNVLANASRRLTAMHPAAIEADVPTFPAQAFWAIEWRAGGIVARELAWHWTSRSTLEPPTP